MNNKKTFTGPCMVCGKVNTIVAWEYIHTGNFVNCCDAEFNMLHSREELRKAFFEKVWGVGLAPSGRKP